VIRHIFKLVWNRKRSTGLITIEILICFLVLCGILASGAHYLSLWQRPLGFDYENVWAVEIDGMRYGADDEEMASDRQSMAALIRAVGAMPEVEAVAIATNQPYSNSSWIDGTWINGKSERLQYTLTSVGQKDVFGIEVLNGRWLDETDVQGSYIPVVITQNLARGHFGLDDPIGKDLPQFTKEGAPKAPPTGNTTIDAEDDEDEEIYRVVGVVRDFRRFGELGTREAYMMFLPVDFEAGEELPERMMIRVRPGTTAQFEEHLVRTMQNIVPQWTYDSQLLEGQRREMLLSNIMPLLTMAVIAMFLIIMVGLGLVGVLWLSVMRRTAELGLRRAMGASGVSVRSQIVGELWALTSLAVLVGTLMFLQLPLFGVDLGIGAGWSGYILGVIAATVIIYVFVTICGLYPAWLATRIQPATALQYE